jgi:hypothetical protein
VDRFRVPSTKLLASNINPSSHNSHVKGQLGSSMTCPGLAVKPLSACCEKNNGKGGGQPLRSWSRREGCISPTTMQASNTTHLRGQGYSRIEASCAAHVRIPSKYITWHAKQKLGRCAIRGELKASPTSSEIFLHPARLVSAPPQESAGPWVGVFG